MSTPHHYTNGKRFNHSFTGHISFIVASSLLFLTLLACTKDPETRVVEQPSTIRIDSAVLTNLNAARVFFTVSNSGSGDTLLLKGICWGKSPGPRLGSSFVRFLDLSKASADTTIEKLEYNTTYYFRALMITTNNAKKDTIYGNEVALQTKGLLLSLNRHYPGITPTQVLALGSKGFIVLSSVFQQYGNIASWPRLTRIDTSGTVLWSREYYASQNRTPGFVLARPDGFVVATTSYEVGSAPYLFKTDSNGDMVWEKGFANSQWTNQIPFQLYTDESSAVVLTALTQVSATSGSGTVRGPLVEYRVGDQGNLLTEKLYPGIPAPGSGYVTSSTPNSQGFLTMFPYDSLLSGSTYMATMRVQKYNASKVPEWNKTFYDGMYTLSGRSALVNNTGNYVMLATSSSSGVYTGSSWLTELDRTTGATLWKTDYPAASYGQWVFGDREVLATNDRNEYYITGIATDYAASTQGLLLAKTDSRGKKLWNVLFNPSWGIQARFGRGVFAYPGNELYVFGTAATPQQTTDLYLLKFKEP
jgi:hypothetical protein